GGAVLDEQPVGASWPHLASRALGRVRYMNRLADHALGLVQDANATVLRGLLALEEGNADEAEVAFRLALTLWKDEATAAWGGGWDFSARPAAGPCLRGLEWPPPGRLSGRGRRSQDN